MILIKGFFVPLHRVNLKLLFLFPEEQTVYSWECFLQVPGKHVMMRISHYSQMPEFDPSSSFMVHLQGTKPRGNLWGSVPGESMNKTVYLPNQQDKRFWIQSHIYHFGLVFFLAQIFWQETLILHAEFYGLYWPTILLFTSANKIPFGACLFESWHIWGREEE